MCRSVHSPDVHGPNAHCPDVHSPRVHGCLLSRASARSAPLSARGTGCLCNDLVSPADEDEPEDAVSDADEIPKSKKKKKAKKSSRESRSSKRQRPIREV